MLFFIYDAFPSKVCTRQQWEVSWIYSKFYFFVIYICVFFLILVCLFFIQHKDQCFSTTWFLEFEKMLQNRNLYLMSKNDYNAKQPTPPVKAMPTIRPTSTTAKGVPKKEMPKRPMPPPPNGGVPIGVAKKMFASYLNF